MENASKALIIAGAILLAISIIGIGMFVYQQAAGTLGKMNMNKEEVTQYNDNFERYLGTQKGTNIRLLCDAIRAHNNANIDDASRNVNIVYGSAASSTTAPTANIPATVPNTVKQQIGAGRTYDVTVSYDVNSGLVVEVGVVLKP